MTRIAAASVALWLVARAVQWTVRGTDRPLIPGVALVALVCGWFALMGHSVKSRTQMKAACVAGLVLGLIGGLLGAVTPFVLSAGNLAGFAAFVGPFYFAPIGAIIGIVLGIAGHYLRGH